MLYDEMLVAHKKIGLPTSYGDLAKIGVTKGHIIKGIKDIKHKNCLYLEYFHGGDFSILDRVSR